MRIPSIVLLVFNVIMLILALVAFGYSIFVVSTEGKLCMDCLAIPTIWAWAAFGLTLCVALISALAIFAIFKHIKGLLIFMSLFIFITFAATVALTVILSMWTSQTDLGAISGVVLTLESQLKLFLANWGIQHPLDWLSVQDGLVCCGVGLEACYSFPLSSFHTGQFCSSAIDAEISVFLSNNPIYTRSNDLSFSTVLKTINQGVDYFCENRVRTVAQAYTVWVAAILGVLSFLQFVAFILSNYLICCVKKEDGGYAEIDFETGEIEKPMVALVNNTKELTQETKQFANRVSTRVGLGVAHATNRVSMQMGGRQVFDENRFKPPPGMPPPGLNSRQAAPPPPGIKSFQVIDEQSLGPEYAKYTRMKKSGLPMGAVQNAMERDGVAIPPGFFDGNDEDSSSAAGASAMPPPVVRKPNAPPVQAVKNFASRVSHRVSMKVGGMFAPPPPPPGFGGLPEQPSFSAPPPGLGESTMNPSFKGPSSLQQEEFAPIQAPPVAAAKKAPPPAAPAKKAPAPEKKAPPPAKAKPVKATTAAPAKTGGGGAPGFLGDIGGGGGFQLKKTVTNDRSGPNLNLKG